MTKPLDPLAWKEEGNCITQAGETFIMQRSPNSPGDNRYTTYTVGPELFFPERGGSSAPAKRVCSTCPVKERCAAYAIDNFERHGVWGGLSERERRRLRKERRAA